jgi:hypothetical protein
VQPACTLARSGARSPEEMTHAAAPRRRSALAAALCAALASAALGAGVPPSYDAPLPAVLRVCVQAYAPFVMQRVRVFAAASRPISRKRCPRFRFRHARSCTWSVCLRRMAGARALGRAAALIRAARRRHPRRPGLVPR